MKIENLEVVLTVESFKAWLLAKPSDWTFRSNHAELCPIACYLQDSYPGVQVFPTGVTFGSIGDEEVELPFWASEFVRMLDYLYLGAVRIRPGQALEILDACTAEDFSSSIASLPQFSTSTGKE